MTTPVTYEQSGGVARVALNMPEKRNALSVALVRALNDALDAAGADPLARVVILSANGPAFCAGMDLKSVALDDPKAAKEFSTALAGAYRRLLMLPAPLLAAVDGPAMGGAVGLALAADVIWVGPQARFAFPETRVGVVPALVSVPARRRISVGKLHALCITGVGVDAEDAVRLGLAEYAAKESALADAETFAAKLVQENSAEAMHRTKAFLQGQFLPQLNRELDDALHEFEFAVASDACKKGLAAFREKRTPNWAE